VIEHLNLWTIYMKFETPWCFYHGVTRAVDSLRYALSTSIHTCRLTYLSHYLTSYLF